MSTRSTRSSQKNLTNQRQPQSTPILTPERSTAGSLASPSLYPVGTVTSSGSKRPSAKTLNNVPLAQVPAQTTSGGGDTFDVTSVKGSRTSGAQLKLQAALSAKGDIPSRKSRKRVNSDLQLDSTISAAGASTAPNAHNPVAPLPRAVKKAKRATKLPVTTQASTPPITAAAVNSKPKGVRRNAVPKPRAVRKRNNADVNSQGSAIVESSSEDQALADTAKAQRRAATGVNLLTTIPRTDSTIVPDPAANVADRDDVLSEPESAEAGSDSCDGADPDDLDAEEVGQESGSDLENMEPAVLGQQLATEQPVWNQEQDTLSGGLSTGGGKGKAREEHSQNYVPQLDLNDEFESDDSGSEFQPESTDLAQEVEEAYVDDDGERLDDPMELDDALGGDANEEGAAIAVRVHRGKQASGKKAASATLDARRALEHPVWKDTTISPATHSPATTSVSNRTPKSTGQLGSHAAAASALDLTHAGPVILFPEDDSETHLASTSGISGLAALAPGRAVAPTNSSNLSSESYSIVLPTVAGAALSLNAQHPHIQETCRACFIQSEVDLVFDNAFPDGLERTKFVINGLITAANALGYSGLCRRYQTDETFLRQVSSIAKQRISTFRGIIKKVAQAHTVAHYSIVPGQCVEKINWMLPDMIYVYPFTYEPPKRVVSWAKPYLHPSIPSILRQCFFAGSGSIGTKYTTRFTSSLPERPDEKEIPMPMLALVGTAIHASLLDWKQGSFKSTAFSSDAYLDIYNEHLILLQGIQQSSARGYHNIAYELYRIASGASAIPTSTGETSAASALAHVDFDNMNVD